MNPTTGSTWRFPAILSIALLTAGCWDSSTDAWDEEDEYGYENDDFDLGDVIVGTVAVIWGDDDGDGGGGGGSSGYAVQWTSARSDLVRASNAAPGAGRGVVLVGRSRRREEFRIEGRGLPAARVLDVFLLDARDVEVFAGSMITDYRGRAGLHLRSGGWESHPGTAPGVEALAGAPVEVRDAAGTVVLRGSVPSLGGRGSRAVTETVRAGESAASASVRLSGSSRAGRRRARVDLRGLPVGVGATLLVEDAEGTLRPEAEAEADQAGEARFHFDSRRGEPLPGEAFDLPDLSGRGFEVRVGGYLLLEGAFPPF